MNDTRELSISTAGSRKATQWKQEKIYWHCLADRLKTPVRSTETVQAYMSLKKPQQDDLKDVGGFVGGSLGPTLRRTPRNVTGRDLVALDLDRIQAGGTTDILRRIDGLGCTYVVYSTRKHTEAAPRLRVLLPLDRTCTADEYEPVARKVAAMIGIDLCDPTTFQVSRLMYWPSCCSDGQYVYRYGEGELLSADGVLAMYTDWHNVAEWPQVPGESEPPLRRGTKQQDPTEKPGLVGAFCRVYDVYKAIETFIPDAYTEGSQPDRLSYTGGTTSNGAIVYESGKFLYSHHAHDPAGGGLRNAFDLVRLHLYADLDDDARPGTPTNKLPSYRSMQETALADEQVVYMLGKEQLDKAKEAFSTPVDVDDNWTVKLQRNATGQLLKTIDNMLLILENDPMLKGKIGIDRFANRGAVLGQLPWDERTERRNWTDNDDCGVQWYIEKVYNVSSKDKVMSALSLASEKNAFNDVVSYLLSLRWDGVKRLDTLFIDYLGADDSEYVRTTTRKAFVAAVARAMTPGVKFDYMVILVGSQGIGKSSLLRKMGKNWYSDSLRTFEGKEASELVQGMWLVEVGELEAFNKSQTDRIKQFLSMCDDIFRVAYGRRTDRFPRTCVFFGTTNRPEHLRDETGNRRFWPIDVGVTEPVKRVYGDLDIEADQIWAEAYVRWQLGESLYLPKPIEDIAREKQEEHRERSVREGIVQEFVEKKVPPDWQKWDLSRRRIFWSGGMNYEGELVERDRICALEVWCEAFDGDKKAMKNYDARDINTAISMLKGWEKSNKVAKFGYCGAQRGFRNVTNANLEN